MVRVRRTNTNTRRTTLHQVRRNRRSRRTFYPIITLDNDIISPNPEIIDLESQSPEHQIPLIILEPEIIDLQEDTENIIPLTQPSTSNHYTSPGLVEGPIDGYSNCSTISLTSNNHHSQGLQQIGSKTQE